MHYPEVDVNWESAEEAGTTETAEEAVIAAAEAPKTGASRRGRQAKVADAMPDRAHA